MDLRKLPLAHCKKILESNGKKYSNQQVGKIRDILYTLGHLDYLIYSEMRNPEFNSLEENKAA